MSKDAEVIDHINTSPITSVAWEPRQQGARRFAFFLIQSFSKCVTAYSRATRAPSSIQMRTSSINKSLTAERDGFKVSNLRIRISMTFNSGNRCPETNHHCLTTSKKTCSILIFSLLHWWNCWWWMEWLKNDMPIWHSLSNEQVALPFLYYHYLSTIYQNSFVIRYVHHQEL